MRAFGVKVIYVNKQFSGLFEALTCKYFVVGLLMLSESAWSDKMVSTDTLQRCFLLQLMSTAVELMTSFICQLTSRQVMVL